MVKREKLHQSSREFLKSNKLLLLFLCIYVILAILLFDPTLFTGGDNAVYIILAESIITGKGYRDIHLPEELPHAKYPFGFPLLLSFFILIFGSHILVLKLVVLLTGLGAFYFMYRIGKFLFEEKVYIVMLFYLSILAFMVYSHRILSEMPFLFFSLGTLYFFTKAQTGKPFFYYISFVLATYTFFIRTAGISLIIAMMLVLLLKKHYKYLGIFAAIFLVCFIPWYMRNASIPNAVSYIDQFLISDPYHLESERVSFIELVSRVWGNFAFYSFTILPKTLLPILRGDLLLSIAGLIFTALILVGFAKERQKCSVINFYFIFAIIILLGWPIIWSSERFLLPILPIIVLYLFFGIFWLEEKFGFTYVFRAAIVMVIILNFVVIIRDAWNVMPYTVQYFRGDRYAGYSKLWRNHFEIIDWIKENIPEDKIIMARKPEFVYLLSKHQSLSYPFSDDYNEVMKAINRTDYILLDRAEAMLWLYPVLMKDEQKYEQVYNTDEPVFFLLRVKK